MIPEHAFVPALLSSAVDRPVEVLIELWCRLDHRILELGFDSAALKSQAERAAVALERRGPLPQIHPAAALRAVSDFLDEEEYAEEVELRCLPCPHCGRKYVLLRRRERWRSRVGEARSGHREYWMRHYQIVPVRHGAGAGDLDLAFRDLPALVRSQLRGPALRFAAGGFEDSSLPDWNGGSPYRCSVLNGAETRWASIQALLEAAVAEGAQCVVLPELTVDVGMRRRLGDWLKLHGRGIVLVVAGSFHEKEEETGRRRNVAHIFDGGGHEILAQKKLKPMRTQRRGEPCEEDIEGHHEAVLLRAPFGLVGLAICLDYCFWANASLASLWHAAGPALMLVPSMATHKTNKRHLRRAAELHEIHGTATLVASQHPEKPQGSGLSACGEGRRLRIRRGRPSLIHEIRWLSDDED